MTACSPLPPSLTSTSAPIMSKRPILVELPVTSPGYGDLFYPSLSMYILALSHSTPRPGKDTLSLLFPSYSYLLSISPIFSILYSVQCWRRSIHIPVLPTTLLYKHLPFPRFFGSFPLFPLSYFFFSAFLFFIFPIFSLLLARGGREGCDFCFPSPSAISLSPFPGPTAW